jgi:prepilin-type N-terminal cleavage/methylation domain-containing protein
MLVTMKGRRALRRRQSAGGFTLMELMVVVILVAILAMLAAPGMNEARNDRIAFDYARQYQQILMRARSRAAGTGSAHLVLLWPGAGGRGTIRSFSALDGQPSAPFNLPGPNPVSSCKQLGQWTDSLLEPPLASGPNTRFIDFSDINRNGVNVSMDLRARLSGTGLNMTSSFPANGAIAICISPSGVTYAGGGADGTSAIEAMRTAPPFTGQIDAEIQRHSAAGTPIGLKRRVIVTGGGNPRIKSE